MANIFSSNPFICDTDFTSYRTATGASFGIKPSKVVLSVGAATSVAGVVTVTRPADSAVIYPPLLVGASPANTELYVDDPSSKAALNWNDFAVTGLTATGTKMYVWYNI